MAGGADSATFGAVSSGELPDDSHNDYTTECADLGARRIRAAAFVGLCVAPFYALADWFRYPTNHSSLLQGRVLCVLLFAGIWALMRTATASRFANAISLLLGAAFALTVAAAPAGYIPSATPFVLVILTLALWLPWQPLQVVAFALMALAMYSIASVHDAARRPAFMAEASLIVVASAIATAAVDAAEKLRRHEFQFRRDLRDAYRANTQLGAALAERSAQLESTSQEMEDLLYAASHDLRAPLINIQGFSRELHAGLTQLYTDNGKSPEVRAAWADVDESLQFILTAVHRMDVLIASLLSVSRVATRTNATQSVDLNALVGKLAESFHAQLTEQQIALEVTQLPTVTGDPMRLAQLFGNLIDNAITHMGTCAERRISVGLDENGERRFFVHDTGAGIPRDAREHVFRLFRRFTNEKSPGKGIGLTLARKIVEKHGGKIWLDSDLGHGTTFWFTLQMPVQGGASEEASYARA